MRARWECMYNPITEREIAEQHIRGPEYHSALWEFAAHLRNVCKHGEHSEEVSAALDSMRSQLYRILGEYGLEL